MGLFDFINRILEKNEHLTTDVIIDLPLKYSDFPKYNGRIKTEPKETITDKYSRITIFYKGRPNKEYYNLLNTLGYVQGSDVRFDKDNTYIIVEKIGFNTKIAYHIKES